MKLNLIVLGLPPDSCICQEPGARPSIAASFFLPTKRRNYKSDRAARARATRFAIYRLGIVEIISQRNSATRS